MYYDRQTEDGKDPVYGYELKPVTPDVIPRLMALEKGCNSVDPQNDRFFNPTTQDAQVWYYQKPDGNYDFFDGPCYHPQLGVRLEPVTRAIVRDWRSQIEAREEAERRRREQQRIEERRREKRRQQEEQRRAEIQRRQAERRAERQAEARRKAKEKAKAERERQERMEYREQYLNTSVLEQLRGNGPVVLILAIGDGSFRNHLTRAFRRKGMNVQSGLLKRTALQSDGVSGRLAGGDERILRRLGLSQLSGHLLLCDFALNEPTDTGRVQKTHARLNVAMVPLSGGGVKRRTFAARGAGFYVADAERQARERVVKDFFGSSLIAELR